MYHQNHVELTYYSVTSINELKPEHKELLLNAREASWKAYAPYSKFNVGAAARLEGGEIVLASNKENASFPAGVCAERNLLNYISDQFSGKRIVSLAIAANPVEFQLTSPISPCGICRQVMCESERNQGNDIEIIIGSEIGEILIFSSAASLLPMHFQLSQLKK
ncbi:MAG: cytidine deaminase [Flavobacteriales bacterium]